MMLKLDTTYIDEANVYQCNYCGAFANTVETIKHFETCTRVKGEKQYNKMFEDKQKGV